ncbi:MAG: hypothetical protein D4R97_01355 [Bacteroidetes bacterium]|nr:MAG: hypothetical protein D4R97_01355 [Bacteroidota bacterium]
MLWSNSILAQVPLLKQGSTSSTLFEWNTTYDISAGFNDIAPNAKFHIKASSLTEAVFMASWQQPMDSRPTISVSNCFFNDPYYYGIYQTGPTNGTGFNYFQNSIGIGVQVPPTTENQSLFATGSLYTNNSVYANGAGGFMKGIGIGTFTGIGEPDDPGYTNAPYIHAIGDLVIYVDPDNYTQSAIMKLHSDLTSGNQTFVYGKLITNQFMLTHNAGENKMLTSDRSGNGTWTDKDWLETYNTQKIVDPPDPNDLSIYLNPKFKKVGIGVMVPHSALAVNGEITAKEVEVTLDGWPDYVLNDNYNLRPLKDLENYIQVNKHLPEIPTEKEVKDQGVKLGEMNALLVKKVEELTLYIIKMQKEIEELKAEHTTK